MAASARPQSQVMNLALKDSFHDPPLSLVLAAVAAEQADLVVAAVGE